VSDPQSSPDGSRIAWVQTVMDKESDSYRSSIMVSSLDGHAAIRMTSGAHRDSAPRWSPDGTTLVFESNRPSVSAAPGDGEETGAAEDKTKSGNKPAGTDETTRPTTTQLWTIRVDGGEAMQLTEHPSGAGSAAWAPDGTHIVFVASDELDKDAAEPPPMRNGDVADERIINRMHFRADGRGFLDKVPHLWSIRLSDRTASQLTFGDTGVSDPAWSPDGTKIAFVSNRSADRKRYWNRNAIHVLNVDNGEISTITPEDAQFDAPRWSPGGDRIAFVGHLDAASGGALNDRIWTVQPDGSDIRNHTETWDVSAESTGMSDLANASQGGPVWLNDRHILTRAAVRGAARIFNIDLDDGTPAALTAGPHVVSGFTVAGERLVYVQGSIDRPNALHTSALDGSDVRAFPDPNQDLLASVDLSPAIELSVTSADGLEIQGWLLTPAGFSETSEAKHPLIVQIHGGPHAMYGYAMFHEMQLMAARGYAVLFTNPRGSAGYGERFTGSTRGRWGEADMPDVIAAVEQVSSLPWIDTSRIGITGGSYGGYLTNWIIGHDSRFKAAVTQRCVSNFHSFFGTSDIGSTFGAFEFDGVPWRDAEKLLRYSPISYVESMTTPLLILHSEQDHRCPIEQAEQLYTALSYLEREVKFVRFPEEGHELSRSGTPSRRLARLHHLIGWFDTHL
jgi:dipeptidyl aminopeptidase/acylaminoacyl peptidase